MKMLCLFVGTMFLLRTVPLSGQPTLVKDLYIGTSSSSPGNFIEFAGKVYFTATKSVNRTSLYMSDGTEAGTMEVKDVLNPHNLSVMNNALYFFADDALKNKYLWRSDGTPNGTFALKQVLSYSYSTYPDLLTAYNGLMVFRCYNQLWRSDGTAAGTVMIDSVIDHGVYNCITEFNGKLYFKGKSIQTGAELWSTDGSQAGTYLVKDVRPGPVGGLSAAASPTNLIVLGNAFYFTADDSIHARQLWRSDGTASGTFMVKDINPTDANIRNLIKMNGNLYFVANQSPTDSAGIWKSDGTAAGTQLLKTIEVLYSNLVPAANILYFNGEEQGGHAKLWKTDGTKVGTTILKEYPAPTDVFASSMMVIDDALYFALNDPVYGTEPWISDGSAAGTRMIYDMRSGFSSSGPSGFTKGGGSIYFSAIDGVIGRELWKMPVLTFVPEPRDANNLIHFFPNPNNGSFTISLSSTAEICIFNTVGEEVFRRTVTGTEEITLVDSRSGIYVMSVANKAGSSFTKIWVH